jgi:hypothetical protein
MRKDIVLLIIPWPSALKISPPSELGHNNSRRWILYSSLQGSIQDPITITFFEGFCTNPQFTWLDTTFRANDCDAIFKNSSADRMCRDKTTRHFCLLSNSKKKPKKGKQQTRLPKKSLAYRFKYISWLPFGKLETSVAHLACKPVHNLNSLQSTAKSSPGLHLQMENLRWHAHCHHQFFNSDTFLTKWICVFGIRSIVAMLSNAHTWNHCLYPTLQRTIPSAETQIRYGFKRQLNKPLIRSFK